MTFCVRDSLLVLFLASIVGCQVNNDTLSTEVLTAVMPDEKCTVTPTSIPYSEGFYDPTVDGAQGYRLALLMRNNMMAAAEEEVEVDPIDNINRRGRDMQITSFDGCWYSAEQESVYGGGQNGNAVDCDELPEQRQRIAVFATVDEGGVVGVVQLRVLDLTALRQIFGAGYTPSQIPSTGRYVFGDPSVNPQVANGSQAGPARNGYFFAPEDPADMAARSPFWGARHPPRRDAKVLVQLRANMVTQTGDSKTGAWFRFPITVCTGCLQDACGPLVEEVCARGPCSDGTECLKGGVCANTELTCSPLALYSGARPDFYGASGETPCMPAQNHASTPAPKCQPVGCRATE